MDKSINIDEKIEENTKYTFQPNIGKLTTKEATIAKLQMLVAGGTKGGDYEGIIGADNRTLVKQLSDFPYYSTCKLLPLVKPKEPLGILPNKDMMAVKCMNAWET